MNIALLQGFLQFEKGQVLKVINRDQILPSIKNVNIVLDKDIVKRLRGKIVTIRISTKIMTLNIFKVFFGSKLQKMYTSVIT